MTTELSNVTAKLSQSQLEISGLQQKENQLKVQLAAALSQAQERQSDLENLKSDTRGMLAARKLLNPNLFLTTVSQTDFSSLSRMHVFVFSMCSYIFEVKNCTDKKLLKKYVCI